MGSGPHGRIQAADVPEAVAPGPVPAWALLTVEVTAPCVATERLLAATGMPLAAVLVKTCAWALARQKHTGLVDDRITASDILTYDLSEFGAARGGGPLVPPAVAALTVGRDACFELRLVADARVLSIEGAGRLLADVRAVLDNPYLLLG